MKALIIAEEIAEKVNGSVHEKYSGRAMYGKTCIGIVCLNYTKCIEQAAKCGFSGAKTDSMGLDVIVYWPRIQADTEIAECEDDSDEA